MTAPITVDHFARDRFLISVSGHRIVVDQPVVDGGDGTAPTPTELFVASLASCVAFYARRYLARHDLPEDGLSVRATYTLATKPARVGEVHLELTLPEGFPPERTAALISVASHCTVHNSLTSPPEVSVDVAPAAGHLGRLTG